MAKSEQILKRAKVTGNKKGMMTLEHIHSIIILADNIMKEYERLAKSQRYTLGKIYDKLCEKFSPIIREEIKSIIHNSLHKKM